MRNRTKLLLLLAIALAGAACLLFRGPEGTMAAKAPELTDSGALPAQVLFPVSAKPNPGAVGMKPVVFNHKIHETKVQECESCHHTGDPVPCATCHTVEGSALGNFITLDRAMHANDIKQRKNKRTPESCVSCHEKLYTQRKECAGCHAIVQPTHNEKWCAVCHVDVPNLTKDQFAKGVAGKLDPEENMQLALNTIKARKPVKYTDPTKMNYRVKIDTLVNKYEPNYFNHARHIVSVERKIKDNTLAQAFHSTPEILCQTCHHHSPSTTTPSKCVSCHNPRIDKEHPGRPTLMAAYHLQCMGCHDGMQVKRPRKNDCTGCHKLRMAKKGDQK